MSWREILGVIPSPEMPYTHNSHNSQKADEPLNSADIANSAYSGSEEDSKLLEVLADGCRGLAIAPSEVKEALSAEDIEDWRRGYGDALPALARSLVQRREMDRGIRPDTYTQRATCRHCGPIWLWFAGEVLGCPWCWNRLTDGPIPRPCGVQCGACAHFERIDHPNLGHCGKGEPEAIAGLWDRDRRYCERFLPRIGE